MRLGDICTIKYGKDHKKLNDGDIPVYGSGGVMRHVEKALWNKPSVLIPRKGTLGNLFFVNKPFWTVDTCFWTDIDEEQVLPEYLFYQLKTKDLASLNVGTAVPSLTTDVLNEVEIDLPSLEKQKQVVEMLGSLDSKIEINTKLNGYLEGLCQTLFDRFEADENNTFVPITSIAYVNPKRTLKKGTKALCVEMANLSTGGSFPSDWHVKAYHGGMKFKNGDTIMARITPCLENGKTCYVNFLEEGQTGFGSTEYIVMAAKDILPSEFFYFLARNSNFVSYAIAHMNGSSGRQRVSSTDIEEYEVRMPNSSQLIEFEKIAVPAIRTIRANSFENRKLTELRNALLPKLMSGEIDVSKIDLAKLNSHLA